VLVVTGCSLSGKPSGGGDPGNRRLHQLADDPIFSVLPPGAGRAEVKLTPARYEPVSFSGGGWHGPSVSRTFESSAEPISVFAFYGERAREEGWAAALAGSLHVTDRWRKSYPNGATGYLSIFTSRPFEAAAGPRQYQLQGGISLPG
jgi:hypothetical protein